MTDMPEPQFEAWHIPCYSSQKCPTRTKTRGQGLTTPPSSVKQAGFYPLFGYDVSYEESNVISLFLYTVTFLTVGGIVIVLSALIYRKGCRRPLNQFLIFMLKSDLTMALFVIPLHVVEVFADRTSPLGSVICLAGTFVHLVSTCTRSWAIAAFIFLYHVYSGLIPPSRSLLMLTWIWIASMLLSVPIVVSANGSFIDSDTCTLVADSYGFVVYVTVMNYFLPAFILTPFFMKWSNITRKFGQRFDLSCDILAEREDEVVSKLGNQEGNSLSLDGAGQVEAGIVTNDDLKDDGNCFHGDNEVCRLCEDDFSLYEDFFRKPSIQTRLFLLADPNFPRIMFALGILHILTWGAFYLLVLIAPTLSSPVPPLASLLTAWFGYTQCALTPILIYLLSDRVYKTINDLIYFILSLAKFRQGRMRHGTSGLGQTDL